MIKHFNKIATIILSLAVIGTVFPANASEKGCNNIETNVVHDEDGYAVLELTSDNNFGFKKVNDNIQFYDVTGKQVKSSWINSDGKWYYFDESGNMVKGWKCISDNWYYFSEDGSRTTGWLEKNNKWYYLGEDGIMKKSQNLTISGVCYYFDSNGIMVNSIKADK